MSEPRSDALAFFGATGDLAYKKIFPALHAMARRGHQWGPQEAERLTEEIGGWHTPQK